MEQFGKEKMVKDNLCTIILRMINEAGAVHGYKVISDIRRKHHVYLGASTVYPLLHYLLDKEYVKSIWITQGTNERPLRVYTLTPKGTRALDSMQTDLGTVVLPLLPKYRTVTE